MTADILTVLGAIGLFLIGMQTMTEALRQLAGRQTRTVLARFTRTPLMGALSGMLTTAAIQSSSATTVTVVGFVGAGLIGFPQAVGVIFGANLGTTITGWMVVLFGFKLKLGLAALPVLLAGALLQARTRGTAARVGAVLVGFGLLFLGLEMMTQGLSGFSGFLTPATLPPDTWPGRTLLVVMGIAATLVTQSSSAGVATTLALLGTGSIGFTQAAALVIGMDIGTTGSALLASVGGSRAMRQTGVAHVVYNLVTGAVAFLLLGFAQSVVRDGLAGGDNQTGLVAFHTLFNLVGGVLTLPLARPFARMIEWLVPDRPGPLTEALDRRLLASPDTAIDAAGISTRAIMRALAAGLAEALRPGGRTGALERAVAETAAALDVLQAWLARIVVPEDQAAALRRYSALLHAYDHLHRLHHRCTQTGRLPLLLADPRLRRPALLLGGLLRRAAETGVDPSEVRMAALAANISARMHRLRAAVMAVGAARPESAEQIFALADSMRWLDRTVAHLRSINHYQAIARQMVPA